MLNTLTSAVIFGAAVVSAAPAAWGPMSNWGQGASSTVSSYSAGQTPFSFPLANGFPNVSDATLHDIEEAAHGTLPNGALPTEINATSAIVLELIAFNELFEVAFFTSLIQNITSNVEGFQIDSQVLRSFVLETLIAVQAQEELHALGANGILASAGRTQIQPCEYVFPVDNFDDAIGLARTFTDVVLGTLQDAQNTFATDGDAELVALIGSVIGQEGEQNGYYRSLLNLIPSSNPFLTRSAGQFAFSALNQNFVVNGSCPPVDNVLFNAIPILGALTVDTANILLEDQTLTFSVKSSSTDFSEYSVVFINQQNLPVVEPITNVKSSAGTVTFDAHFPGAQFIMDGLTIAAVTKSAGPFASVPEVAANSVFGPGLIEIN
ncbi:hypothetical protein LTR36_003764 [Oleoguttula mirabilis]|uniref:Sexual development protein n=1 Tax=Oleoguttula mirabilis TaxID=1507867 RepID=A0AAV9JI06_9PEZI|nr:hypothetical protein LTR36_003764 [Oleoguttula mirabilis]